MSALRISYTSSWRTWYRTFKQQSRELVVGHGTETIVGHDTETAVGHGSETVV